MTNPLRQIESLVQSVKGFLDIEEGRRLYEIAGQACRLGPCLEIGSYCGKSTLFLGAACRDAGSVLFSVDHHRGSEEQQPGEEYFDSDLFDAAEGRVDTFRCFRKTLSAADLEDTVIPLVCRSELAARCWKTPLALVFIDGGHAEPTVLADYESWAPHVLPRGFLLFHDIYEDPKQGGQAPYRVMQLALKSGHFRSLSKTGSLAVLQRVSH